MVNHGFKCSDELVNEWLSKKKNKSKTILRALINEHIRELNEKKKDKESKIEVVING